MNIKIKSFTLAEGAAHVENSGKTRKGAFTLAEVLITLGIIGIVAAMTLPTIINNARDRQFRAMFKKQFSIISQAFQMVYLDDGIEIDFEDWRDMTTYVCQIGQKLKAAYSGLKCDEILTMVPDDAFENHINKNVSWHKNNTWYNAKKLSMVSNSGYSYMTFYLPDGAWINFNCWRYVFVDVNGAKNPNTVGRDIFYFVLPKRTSALNFFDYTTGKTWPNGCQGGIYSTTLTPDNYEDDCKNGTGWGCSPMYILD